MKKSESLKGLTCLIIAQSMVGINIVTSKLLLVSIPVLILLAIRFSIASLILLPLHWATPSKNESIKTHLAKLSRKELAFILAQALCAGVFFNCLMLTGLNYTDANVAGIITSALPAIIALMSWLVLGEKISAQKAFSVAFACLGLIVIAYEKLTNLGSAHSFFGDFIIVLSLIPEATYYILCKLSPNRLPIFLTTAILNGLNAILLLPAIFILEWTPLNLDLQCLFILFIISLTAGLFYVFWFIGAKRVDGILASLSTAIMPVSTVILAWLILGEALSLMQFSGMALVIFSIVLYARSH